MWNNKKWVGYPIPIGGDSYPNKYLSEYLCTSATACTTAEHSPDVDDAMEVVDTILVSKRHYTVVSSDPCGCLLCAITSIKLKGRLSSL